MLLKLVGSCHICGAPAMNTCSFCGRVVCRGCYDPAHGICINCARSRGLLKEEEFEESNEEF